MRFWFFNFIYETKKINFFPVYIFHFRISNLKIKDNSKIIEIHSESKK